MRGRRRRCRRRTGARRSCTSASSARRPTCRSSSGCWRIADGHRAPCSTSYRPDAVAIERVFAQHNLRTVMGTAQASGVALRARGRARAPGRAAHAERGQGGDHRLRVGRQGAGGHDGGAGAGARRGPEAGGCRGRPRARDLPCVARTPGARRACHDLAPRAWRRAAAVDSGQRAWRHAEKRRAVRRLAHDLVASAAPCSPSPARPSWSRSAASGSPCRSPRSTRSPCASGTRRCCTPP